MKKKPNLTSPTERIGQSALDMLAEVIEFANTEPGALTAVYNALFGVDAAPREAFLASAIVPHQRGADALAKGLSRAAREHPGLRFYLGAVTPANLTSRADRVEVSICQARKFKSCIKKCDIPNAIFSTTILHRPAKGKAGLETYLRMPFVVWADNLQDPTMQSLERAARNLFKTADGETTLSYEPIDPSPAGFGQAAVKLFEMHDKPSRSKSMGAKAKEMGIKNWKAQRSFRAFLRFQALATISLKPLLVGHGDGERMMERLLVDGKHALKGLAKGTEEVLHRDQVLQFLASELVRLKLPQIELPFLRVR